MRISSLTNQGGLVPFFLLRQLYIFGKNVKSTTALECYTHIVVFVWRQLEFAFFGAVTPVAALFIFTEKYLYFKEKK